MAKIYLALGSNVGDCQANIEKAIELLAQSVTSIVRANTYKTKAVGYTDQPDFLNTVVKGDTNLSPNELLLFIKSIEKQVGRVERFRWGPREVDIDIIFYEDLKLKQPKLNIPHSHFRERDFVLKPLNDIEPNYVDPVTKLTVKELLDLLPKDSQSILEKLN